MGALQLFAGYVESYTLVTLAIAAYLLVSLRTLQRGGRDDAHGSPFVPGLVLGCAMSLHLLAGWLLPSLLALALRSRAPGPALARAALGVALPLLAMAALLAALGVPASAAADTHLAGLKFIFLTPEGSPHFRFGFLSLPHLVAIANELWLVALPGLLACTSALLVSPGALRGDAALRFLLVAAAGLQLFAISWNPQIGPQRDWDLFACIGITHGAFGVRALALAVADEPRRSQSLAAIALVGLLLTLPWIWSNHARIHPARDVHGPVHYRLALEANERGDDMRAEAELRETVRSEPDDPAYRYALIAFLLERGRRDEARPHLERFLELAPDAPQADHVRRALEELERLESVTQPNEGPRNR